MRRSQALRAPPVPFHTERNSSLWQSSTSWWPAPRRRCRLKRQSDVMCRPIFFYTGNESPIEPYVNNTGLMWNLGRELGAL